MTGAACKNHTSRGRWHGTRGTALLTIALSVCVLAGGVARADRSAGQGTPGLALEKAGKYAAAAVYYHRALRGFEELWVRFWHSGDQGKAGQECRQLIAEYRDRLKTCMDRARMDEASRQHMEAVNELWMSEYVDQEQGEYKLAFARKAEEAEKHGDFLLATQLRAAAADYCQLVAVPYHEQLAGKLDKQRRPNEAALHRDAAGQHRQQAAMHARVSRGDKVLAGLRGLQGPAPAPDAKLMGGHYFKSYVVYHQRVLSVPGDRWLTGRTPKNVADILCRSGLTHGDEDARLAAVVVLANMGETEAVVAALADKAESVRLAAAGALADGRNAGGWAACNRHADAKVRQAIAPILEPAGSQVLERTETIVELLIGLASSNAEIQAFCQTGLERVTGRKEKGSAAWQEWWKGLGDHRPGLMRVGPDGTTMIDPVVDFGAWWQSGERSIQGLPNPLRAYPATSTIKWQGSLIVARRGEYRFYVRNHGQKSGEAFNWRGGADAGVLHFTTSSAKLLIDGKQVLPFPGEFVDDPKARMRIDYSLPIALEPGLHPIELELIAKCTDASPFKGQGPSARLYWSCDGMLRQLVPTQHLISSRRSRG